MIANNEALPLPCQKRLRIENYDGILSPFTSLPTDYPNGYPAHRLKTTSSDRDLYVGPNRIPADLDFHKAGEAIANDSSIKHIHLYDMRTHAQYSRKLSTQDFV